MEAVGKTEENEIPILLTHCTNPMYYGAEVKKVVLLGTEVG